MSEREDRFGSRGWLAKQDRQALERRYGAWVHDMVVRCLSGLPIGLRRYVVVPAGLEFSDSQSLFSDVCCYVLECGLPVPRAGS
jgi:hypothetical protein